MQKKLQKGGYMWINPSKNTQGMKLDVGAGNPSEGEFQAEGYVLNDIEAHPGIDLVCNILDLEKYIQPETCSVIRASHVLEHFGTKQVDYILNMFRKLLQKGGLVEIFVPNFEWHMQLLSEHKDEEAVLYAFGGQKDEWDYHKTAFTPYLLHKKLNDAGYKIIYVVRGTSLKALACLI